MLWRVLGASVDFIHALAMASWVLGLPLLFWRKWPRLTRAYALYSIAFVVVLQVSHALLGECILTTAARALWQRAPNEGASASTEWFTVRLAEAVFHLTPSHQAIKLVSEGLIVVTALGILMSLRNSKRSAPTAAPPGPRMLSAGGLERRALRKPTKPASSAL